MNRFGPDFVLKSEGICERMASSWVLRRVALVRTDVSEEPVASFIKKTNKKQTPWPLVRERTIPTERPPLVDEI
jgi:hypothetical protein